MKPFLTIKCDDKKLPKINFAQAENCQSGFGWFKHFLRGQNHAQKIIQWKLIIRRKKTLLRKDLHEFSLHKQCQKVWILRENNSQIGLLVIFHEWYGLGTPSQVQKLQKVTPKFVLCNQYLWFHQLLLCLWLPCFKWVKRSRNRS